MSKIQNSIGWCDETGNKVIGCKKVSAGCKNCYAEVGTIARVMRSRAVNPVETWGANGTRIAVADFTAKLRRLNKLCICDTCHETFPIDLLVGSARCADPDRSGVGMATAIPSRTPQRSVPTWSCGVCHGSLRRIRLFADSNSDWLDDKWPIETLAEFLDEIRRAPNVDILLLTKRPENWRDRLCAAMLNFDKDVPSATPDEEVELLAWVKTGKTEKTPRLEALFKKLTRQPTALWIGGWLGGVTPQGVWLGVSVENQAMADLRIPQLLNIPAAVRFLSCEPLLSGVDLRLEDCWLPEDHYTLNERLASVIVGGESGKDRRDCGMAAIVSVADQCMAAGVPVYVKQDCAFKSGQQGRIPEEIWKLKQFPGTVLR